MKPQMTHRDRVLSALNRTGYDRIPVKHEGTPEVNKMLMQHFGLANMEQLLRVLGDDFRYVEPVYCGPELRTVSRRQHRGLFRRALPLCRVRAGQLPRSLLSPLRRRRPAGRPRPLAFPQRRLVRLLDDPRAGRAASRNRALPSAAARPATWTSSTASPERAAWSRC